MKIAVIGAGVSGLVAAYRLAEQHQVTLFEAGDYPGGHTNTVDIEVDGQQLAVDTGFIVFNERTYPNFCALIDELGIGWNDTSMSFGASCPVSGFEYGTERLGSWLAQASNLVNPRLYVLIRDIFRFFKIAKQRLQAEPQTLAEQTLAEFLEQHGFSDTFRQFYIVPMTAAVWSAPPSTALQFPALTLLQFLLNHGLLSATEAPVWRTIKGGSREYVRALLSRFQGELRLNSPIASVRRDAAGATITARGGEAEHFDRILLACHSDQALAMLEDPTAAEREVLGSIAYQPNEAVLHTDRAQLPRSERAWASWNYRLSGNPEQPATLSYHMNRLQHLPVKTPICVSLNAIDEIDPAHVIRRIAYAHPVYTQATVAAQARWQEISGAHNHTWYAGAYWYYGFHEDGVRSALRAVADMGEPDRVASAA